MNRIQLLALYSLFFINGSLTQGTETVCDRLINATHFFVCQKVNQCQYRKELLASPKNITACGFDGKVQKICCPQLLSSTQSPYRIASEKCEQYAGARYINKTIPPIFPGDPGRNITELDCVTTAPLIVHGIPARLKEFPHMALIGYGEVLEHVTWDCGGTLISERYVLSAAHCSFGGRGPAKWARLGELVKGTKTDGNFDKDYSIIERIEHPDYKKPAIYNDIVLFKLESEVQFSPFVRPVCLYNKETLDPDLSNKAVITGWGATGSGEQTSDDLLKTEVRILNDDECKTYWATETFLLIKGYDARSMLCAGDKLFGNDTCQGDSGGPIQVPIETMTCMWAQIGITSAGSTFCNGRAAIYTRIKYFVPWIQKIVWP